VSLFRAPSIAIFVTGFAVVTLSAFGVDRALALALARDRSEEWRRAARYLWLCVGALALLALLAASGALSSLWTGMVYRDLSPEGARALEAAQPLFVRGATLAAALAAATAGSWWALRKGLLGPTGLVTLLGVFVMVDLGRVDDPFIQLQDFQAFARADANIQFLLERSDAREPQRVFSMLRQGQDVRPGIFGLELAAGHHPNDLARYRALIGMVGSGIPRNLGHPNVRSILAVRWILWPEYQLGPIQGLERVSGTNPAAGPLVGLYSSPDGLPMARLVTDVAVVPEESAVEYILSPEFDPVRQVVLPEPAPLALDGEPPQGEVIWEERSPNRARLSVETDRPALLVVAENWYPAWKARVSGEEAPVLRANHTLRAVPIPAGRHEVEFRYESGVLQAGLILSLSSLALLGIVALVSLRVSKRE
jgi:hypothetical protein